MKEKAETGTREMGPKDIRGERDGFEFAIASGTERWIPSIYNVRIPQS